MRVDLAVCELAGANALVWLAVLAEAVVLYAMLLVGLGELRGCEGDQKCRKMYRLACSQTW
jgi:hypothetical protein